MNKKIILGTLVTSSLLTAALLTPNTMAATIEGTARNNDGRLSIVLPQAENAGEFRKLTKDELVKFVESKYNKDAVKEVIGEKDGFVGTGTKVVLKSGTELTVVLYGDVNGDGVINTFDTVAIADNNVGNITLENENAVAAKLTSASEKLEVSDTVRLAEFNVRSGVVIVDENLYPQEEVNIDDKVQNVIEVLKEVGKNNELFNLGFIADENTVIFGFNNTDMTVGDFTGTGLIEKFLEQLNNPDVEEIEVNGTKLTKNSTVGDLKAFADSLLKEMFKDVTDIKEIPVKNLMGKSIDVKITLNSSVENPDKVVEYTLKFKTTAKEELNELKEQINLENSEIVTDLDITTNENGDNVVKISVKEGNGEKTIKDIFDSMGARDALSKFVNEKVDLSTVAEVKSVTIKLGNEEQTIAVDGTLTEMKQKVKSVLNEMFASKTLDEILEEASSLELNIDASDKFLAEYCLESGNFVFDFTTVK